jgi:hypothetical protein
MSIFLTVLGATLSMDKVDIKHLEHKKEVNEWEINELNKKKVFRRQFTPNPKYDYYIIDVIKETRTRGFIGWSTKRDTLTTYIQGFSNNQR